MSPEEIKSELESIVADATKNDHDIHFSDDTQMEQGISISIDRLEIINRLKSLIIKI